MKNKTIGEINIVSKLAQERAKAIGDFYDKALLDNLKTHFPFFAGAKYRKQRVPIYLKIKIPVLEKHSCGYDYDDYPVSKNGYFLTFRKIKLFKIGSRIEKVEYYPKKKIPGGTSKFRRYSQLESK